MLTAGFFFFIAAFYIAYGPHGPRKGPPPGENWQVLKYTIAALLVSSAIFAGIRWGARPPPKTMSREWQEATNEYLKVSDLSMPSSVSLFLLTPSLPGTTGGADNWYLL